MEDQLMRDLLSSSEREPRRGWRCASAEALAAYVDGAGSAAQRERQERHFSECAHCRAEIAALVKLLREEEPPPVPPVLLHQAAALTEDAPGVSSQWMWAAAGVTAAVLAVAVWNFLPSSPAPAPPAEARQEAAPVATSPAPVVVAESRPPLDATVPEVRRSSRNVTSVVILSPQPEATLAPDATRFHWAAVPGALTYEVRVLTESGDIVWETRVSSSSATVPREHALPAGRYYLMVRAGLSEGRSVSSPSMAFTIAP